MRKSKAPRPAEEKRFVDLNETTTIEATRVKLLYLIVGVFAVVLIGVWINNLRLSFKGQTDALGLGRLTDNLTAEFNKYNPASTTPNAQPVINLTAINQSVEGDIATQASADWLEKNYPALGISLKYPAAWIGAAANDKITITSMGANGATTTLLVEQLNNQKKLPLEQWLSDNKKAISGFQLAAKLDNGLKYAATTSAEFNALYFLQASSTRIIKVSARAGDNTAALKTIIERIINTINFTK